MSAKLLRAFGSISLLALVAGSFAALAVVRNRIDVTVSEARDAPSRGPAPLELLAADVAALQRDVAAIGEVLAQLGQDLAPLDERMQEALSSSAAAVESLRANQDRVALELDALQREIAELGSRVDRSAAASAALATGVPAPAAAAPDWPSLPESSAAAIEPQAAIAVEGAPVAQDAAETAPRSPDGSDGPAPRRKTFLAFQLPSRSFSFAGPQRLAIVPSLSRVGFDAKSTLHDFSGVTQDVRGELQVDLADPGRGCAGVLEVDARSLDTGVAGRDENMRELLDVERHPALRFEWLSFEATSTDASAMTVTGTARGRLEMNGRAREVSMPVRVAVDASRRVSIEGEMALRMSDHGVQPPRQLGVISVEDEIRVWIALRARTLGPLQSAPKAAEHDGAHE